MEERPFQRAASMSEQEAKEYKEKYEREMKRAKLIKIMMVRKPELFSEEERDKSAGY